MQGTAVQQHAANAGCDGRKRAARPHPTPRRCAWRRAALLAALLACSACECERREYDADPAAFGTAPVVPLQSELHAGAGATPPPDPRAQHFVDNAYHITQGGRLFRWFNCSGCHSNGGGGIGPALMDNGWRYGGATEQIVASIRDGRPNGMPAFGGKLTGQELWQLAAHVRSLSGNVPKAAAPSRSETMAEVPPPSQTTPQPPKLAPGAAKP